MRGAEHRRFSLRRAYVPVVGAQTPISTLEETLRKSSAVVVVDEHRHPISILTRIDLLHFLLEREHAPA